MTKRRVVITGLGTINPLGNTPDQTWQRVKNGQSGVAKLTKIDTSDLKTDFGGEVNDFDATALFGRKDARRMDPVTQFGLAAAIWAMEDAGIQVTDDNRDDIGVVLGCGMGNFASLLDGYDTAMSKGFSRVSPFYVPMLLADAPAANISIRLGLRGPNMAIATACAAGNNAIGEAAKMIERGAADVMLAGGAEAPLLPIIIAGFNAAGALATHDGNPAEANTPFDLNRKGFVTGEGAAVLVLEEREQALARGAHIYGEFLGYGTSADAYHLSAPPDDGGGAAVAIGKALKDAGIFPHQVSYINAHGTGTQLNDKAETNALKTILGEHIYNIPISSTKPIHSHLLGAAGALEAIICLKAMADNIAPPTINYTTPDPECDLNYVPNVAQAVDMNIVMSNGFGLGGHNATIVLKKHE
jgi:beta-ketoacyl-acyl-carrier-protein synthase II